MAAISCCIFYIFIKVIEEIKWPHFCTLGTTCFCIATLKCISNDICAEYRTASVLPAQPSPRNIWDTHWRPVSELLRIVSAPKIVDPPVPERRNIFLTTLRTCVDVYLHGNRAAHHRPQTPDPRPRGSGQSEASLTAWESGGSMWYLQASGRVWNSRRRYSRSWRWGLSGRLARWAHHPLGCPSWAKWNIVRSLEGQSRCSRRASQKVTERREWWNTTFGHPE